MADYDHLSEESLLLKDVSECIPISQPNRKIQIA